MPSSTLVLLLWWMYWNVCISLHCCAMLKYIIRFIRYFMSYQLQVGTKTNKCSFALSYVSICTCRCTFAYPYHTKTGLNIARIGFMHMCVGYLHICWCACPGLWQGDPNDMHIWQACTTHALRMHHAATDKWKHSSKIWVHWTIEPTTVMVLWCQMHPKDRNYFLSLYGYP